MRNIVSARAACAHQLTALLAAVLIPIRLVLELCAALEELHHQRVRSPAHRGEFARWRLNTQRRDQ